MMLQVIRRCSWSHASLRADVDHSVLILAIIDQEGQVAVGDHSKSRRGVLDQDR